MWTVRRATALTCTDAHKALWRKEVPDLSELIFRHAGAAARAFTM
jgi:hypothetical protein